MPRAPISRTCRAVELLSDVSRSSTVDPNRLTDSRRPDALTNCTGVSARMACPGAPGGTGRDARPARGHVLFRGSLMLRPALSFGVRPGLPPRCPSPLAVAEFLLGDRPERVTRLDDVAARAAKRLSTVGGPAASAAGWDGRLEVVSTGCRGSAGRWRPAAVRSSPGPPSPCSHPPRIRRK